MKSGLAETVTQQIRLPQDDPETVELFVQWLYGTNPSLSDFTDRTFMQLGRLYEFANRLFIRELKNYIIWKLFELYRQRHVPPMELVQYAFEDLPDDASLRKVLVAWYTGHQDTAKTLTGDALRAIPQFAVELVLAMVNKEEGFPDIFALGPESQYEPPGPSPAK